MIDKKADSDFMSYIVYFIIGIIVVGIAIWSVYHFGILDSVKNILPSWGNETPTDDDDFIPAEVIKLESPEKIVFWINGDDAEGIFFNCQSTGWKWYRKDSGWLNADSAQYSTYFNNGIKLQKNKDLILGLVDVDCETGLQMIADRVKKNDEGNEIFAVKLVAKANGKSYSYPYDDEALKDTRILVKRLNLITEQ